MGGDERVSRILEIEWRMLQNVVSVAQLPAAGTGMCCKAVDLSESLRCAVPRGDKKSFEIERASQFASWSAVALESYLCDLELADARGRNVMAERYARMILPGEQARVAELIPPLEEEAPSLIDRIVDIVLDWHEALVRKYPSLAAGARPLHSKDDTAGVPSAETYLRGELATYSVGTLKLYLDHVLKQKADDVNGVEVTVRYFARQFRPVRQGGKGAQSGAAS